MPVPEFGPKEDRTPERPKGAQGPAGRFDRGVRTSRSPRRGASAGSAKRQPSKEPGGPERRSAGPGAADASSGGGAGAGVAGGGSDMRNNPRPIRDADVERDRQKLFPEARTHRDDQA